MSEGGAAYDPDRLPWLANEWERGRKAEWRPVALWAVLAALLIAGAGYWLGMKSADIAGDGAAIDAPPPSRGEATVALPKAAPPAEAVVEPTVQREVEPVAEPTPVRIAEPTPAAREKPRPEPRAAAKPAEEAEQAEPAAEARKPETKARTGPPRAWPADVSDGATGRMVRIGTFSTRLQAKRAWWRIVRIYPGMKRLKAVVVEAPSLRNGRTFYRLQFGTTSQAHSEVLCQRMRIIGQSCIVIGLNEAAKS